MDPQSEGQAPDCGICGALVGNEEKHRRWHGDLDKRTSVEGIQDQFAMKGAV